MDAPQTRPAFVGRAGELARLDAALAEASAGRPRVVLIAGEAGVGKTRLLEQATDRWRGRDLLVLEGACLPGPAAPPYAPVVEILRSLRRAVEPGALAAILGPGRRFITRLVPDLADRSTDLDAQLDPASQVLVFELVAGALERLASRAPLVVVVEDVQWADASSRGLLDFIARGARPGERLLVLATIRSDDLGNDAPARAWAAELMRLPIVERIDLGPLPRSDVATLVGDILGRVPDAGVVAGIMDRTSGNPFLAEELAAAIDHGERELPGHLRE
ncbi:MAG TPA: AAA family ATPase, partial [Candidatus Dormibacteraeota bacterium]|nr:AAA family ATPase [Candidatus Dormibacteraeota bacterium]